MANIFHVDRKDNAITLGLDDTVTTVPVLTASRLLATNASKVLVSSDLASWVTQTANQVLVANDGDGTITLSTPQDIHTGASPTFAGATIGDVAIPGIHTAMSEPSGLADRVAVLSWDDATHTLTITGDHDIYIAGVKTTKGTGSVQLADTTGLYWVYYDAGGTLTASTVQPSFALPWLATVYWNTTIGFDKGLAGEERHGVVMDNNTHEYLHNTVGSRHESGLSGTFDDTTLTITTGKWHDEDIEHAPAEQTTCNVLYKNGAVDFEWDAGASVYYKMNGANLRYNNGNVLADVGANQYMAMWIFVTNDISTPIIALMGQRVDTTLANARDNNKYESLTLGTLPFQEMKLLYRVILRNTGAPPSYVEAQDLRNITNLPGGTYIATSHSVLTNLNLDDHSQYALLAGRVGGQTLYGSDTTAEDLTLGDNSVDGNTITVTQAKAAYTHSQLVAGNPHVVTPAELGLVIGTNVQAQSGALDSIVALGAIADNEFIVGTGAGIYAHESGATVRTSLGLGTANNPQFAGLGLGVAATAGTLVVRSLGADGEDIFVIERSTSNLLIAEYIGDGGTDSCAFSLLRGGTTLIKFSTRSTDDSYFNMAGNFGIGLTVPKTKATIEGTLTLKEQAAADGDTAAYGQLWVKSEDPCELWFTDDAGTDVQLGVGGADAIGTGVSKNKDTNYTAATSGTLVVMVTDTWDYNVVHTVLVKSDDVETPTTVIGKVGGKCLRGDSENNIVYHTLSVPIIKGMNYRVEDVGAVIDSITFYPNQ